MSGVGKQRQDAMRTCSALDSGICGLSLRLSTSLSLLVWGANEQRRGSEARAYCTHIRDARGTEHLLLFALIVYVVALTFEAEPEGAAAVGGLLSADSAVPCVCVHTVANLDNRTVYGFTALCRLIL